ncbi:hypothetical protein OsI_35211 [Oryza sativa Indica Group]|uniref:Uncharacterized protein n=1 Tax=Oryza sativa subsp. indica TaxID=39946 RepID=B8BJ91_ORYSI|nr:hypothetical protein OsI_35211 [Oryza sativa Indica Group]
MTGSDDEEDANHDVDGPAILTQPDQAAGVALEAMRDTSGLTAENRELKLRLQSMEEQAKLRDALNDALREEVQRLKIAAGQVPNMNGNSFNGGLQQQQQQQMPTYFSQQQQMHYLSGHQGRHHHPNNPHNSLNGGQSMSGQTLNDSMDFM